MAKRLRYQDVSRITDRPDMTLDVYRGRKTTIQQQQQQLGLHVLLILSSGCERVAREMPRNCSSLPKLGL